MYDFSKVQDYQSLVGNQIRAAVEKYIPVINIDEVQAIVVDEEEKNSANRSGLALLKLRVVFSVPVMRADNLAVEVAMYIGG